MKVTRKALAQVTEAVLEAHAHSATKYLSSRVVVRATRQLYSGRVEKGERRVTLIVSFGVPNYLERKVIANCRKAGLPLPKAVQIKFPARRRKAKRSN